MVNTIDQSLPLVSIVVNCYNGAQYLNDCIRSIKNQTYENWELIFWDNASNDNSAEIFNSYDDKRLKYFRSDKNVTLGQARAWAVEQCNGEYIGFLDVDDEWLPKKLEIQVKQMIAEETHLSYSSIHLKINDTISSTATPKYKSGYIFNKLLEQFEINMPSSMIKTEALKTLNINFDPNIVGSEEYDLFMQIAAKYNVSVIQEPLCIYRISHNSLTNQSIQNRAQDKAFTFEKLEKNFPAEVLKYNRSYKKAKAKIFYYEFQNYYANANLNSARKSLRKVLLVDYRYILIFLSLLVFPSLYGKILKFYDNRGI